MGLQVQEAAPTGQRGQRGRGSGIHGEELAEQAEASEERPSQC